MEYCLGSASDIVEGNFLLWEWGVGYGLCQHNLLSTSSWPQVACRESDSTFVLYYSLVPGPNTCYAIPPHCTCACSYVCVRGDSAVQ